MSCTRRTRLPDDEAECSPDGPEAGVALGHDLAVDTPLCPGRNPDLDVLAAGVEGARVVRHLAAPESIRKPDQAQSRPRLDRDHVERAVAGVRLLDGHPAAERPRCRDRDLPGLAGQQLAPVALDETGERPRAESRAQ